MFTDRKSIVFTGLILLAAMFALGGCSRKEPATAEAIEVVTETESAAGSSSAEEEEMEEEAASAGEPENAGEAADSSAAEAAEGNSEESGEPLADPTDPAVAYPEEGKTLTIRCFNAELRTLMEEQYPAYEKVSETEGTIGGIRVQWLFTDTEEQDAYWNDLSESLPENKEADEPVDLFLVGAEDAAWIATSGWAMPLSDLGFSEEDWKEQYAYTRELISDAQGNQYGAAWQICPGVLYYRRDIAEEVLESDTPEEVQKAVADWETFLETAGKLQEAGIQITATPFDTYRARTADADGDWIKGGKLQVASAAEAWVEEAKQMLEKEQTTADEMWSLTWREGFYKEGKVFCYLGPQWFFEDRMAAEKEAALEGESLAADGTWGVCAGPQSFCWSGIWLCAAEGTDNPSLVADLIRVITVDPAIMEKEAKKHPVCVNSRTVMEAMAAAASNKDKRLGGQNPYAVYAEAAEQIEKAGASPEDAICSELFQGAMLLHFADLLTYEEATEMFAESVLELHPDIDARALLPEEEASSEEETSSEDTASSEETPEEKENGEQAG